MLDECLEYLESRYAENVNFSYEVIIVDDGSSDGATNVALDYVTKLGSEKVRVLTVLKNRGKGGAVTGLFWYPRVGWKTSLFPQVNNGKSDVSQPNRGYQNRPLRLGMLSARGKLLLFADANGATKFSDIEKLEEEMHVLSKTEINAVVIGSRAHLDKEATATRSLFRTILMYAFHFLVWLLAVRTVQDTQCGLKMFTREAASSLFYALHVERWAFDVELLYLAEKKKMPIKEVAVNWTEIEGSKLVPFWS
ncbi:Dolichyl-phosphate beta-glucosyltransferase [Araneus ventricosus]|uniref:dolichyl-phosphate beta-glucosyltransferase n=1 Tax=Araneus ventricosus TaxID=182803 RepID=A0A4Y2NT23_ARAVE|nr:Dolichyl-phosphate beta-glucosyltransferase [Araneus ventricosus]